MNLKKNTFEDVLRKKISIEEYVRFIRELIPNVKLVAPDIFNEKTGHFSRFVKGYYHVGNYVTDDNDKILILAVALYRGDTVERARSMQRNFVKKLLEWGNATAALVAFYTTESPERWRFSYIRMDYTFSKGKVVQKLTPTKRYSYLVGTDEPCNTAMQRLFPIFMDDSCNPSVDDLEEAFSVEKVTNEFFDLYKEKYIELKEYLESNEDFMNEANYRHFTSEQFAKKLMGQIVFLYFIQKKGWLGVEAFPTVMTEKQYKNAFFARGTKSREIVPKVYVPQADGTYRIVFSELQALSDKDEEFLAGIVKGKPWGAGPKDFMRRMFDGCVDAGKNYFDDYLEPLFYIGLNKNRGENGFYAPLHRRIPFLNGGLFEQLDNYEWENNNFNIPNSLFSNADVKGKRDADGILDIFDRYNFTMNEDEPMEREVAIDPEMLGKVFENLLDVKDRKSKGAFYTPREIVHYMCQETLINHLITKTGLPESDVRDFILYGDLMKDEDTTKDAREGNKELLISSKIYNPKTDVNRLKELDDVLANVKVVDLAVGSGAFLLGMLNEIVKARETLSAYMAIGMNNFHKKSFYAYGRKPYDLKMKTIQNCIFACDIEPSAVDIAKLRLWLSIVIDDEITEDAGNGEFDAHTKPRPLPNLDCNIICGNSLVDEFKGVKLIKESFLLNNVSLNSQMTVFQSGVDSLIEKLISLQDELFFTKEHTEKSELKKEIQEIYNQIILEQISGSPELVDSYYECLREPSSPFILWQLYFPQVFKNNKGFDIVIGNPPYVNIVNLESGIREYLQKHYVITKNKVDLYAYFVELANKLVNQAGQICFIIPQTWKATDSFEKFRKLIFDNYRLKQVVNLEIGTFDATVRPVIIQMEKSKKLDNYSISIRNDKFHEIDSIPVSEVYSTKQYILDTESTGKDKELFKKIELSTTPLGEVLQFTRGIKTSNDKRFIKTEKENEDCKKVFRGKNIKAYTLNWNGEYIWYRPDLMREKVGCVPHEKSLFEVEEKIVTQRVNSSMQLLAAYDNEQNYFLDTTNVSKVETLKKGIALKYVLALMNSKLINFWYCYKYRMPTIGLYELHSIPVKEVDEKKQVECIILVDAILEKVHNQEGFSDIKNQLDDVIFDIYGISEDEREYIREK